MHVLGSAATFLRIQPDQGIDAHDGDAGLDGALELLDLAHAGLDDARLEHVAHLADREVEAVVAVRLGARERLLVRGRGRVARRRRRVACGRSVRRGRRPRPGAGGRRRRRRRCRRRRRRRSALRQCVARTQLGDQVRRVERGVDGERLGYDEQRGRERADGELFARALVRSAALWKRARGQHTTDVAHSSR